MFPIHQVWPKPFCKAQWKGVEDKADRGRGGKTTSGNGQAWSSASPRGQWRTRKKWTKLVAKSSVVPQQPSRLRDWWWWWWCVCLSLCVSVCLSLSLSLTHRHRHRHRCTDTQTHRHTYIHTYIHACMHACMHAHTCMHTHIHTHTHTRLFLFLCLLPLTLCPGISLHMFLLQC